MDASILFWVAVAVTAIFSFYGLVMLFVATWAEAGASGGGRGVYGCLGTLLLLPVVSTVILIIIGRGFREAATIPAVITFYVAVLGTLTAALAWTVRNTKESLHNRAEVLILEQLSHGSMSRSEIRNFVHGTSFLFRLSRTTYIEALNALLKDGRIYVKDAIYHIKEPPNTITGSRRRNRRNWPEQLDAAMDRVLETVRSYRPYRPYRRGRTTR